MRPKDRGRIRNRGPWFVMAMGLLSMVGIPYPARAASPQDPSMRPLDQAYETCLGPMLLEFPEPGSFSGDLATYVNDYDPGPSGCTGHPAAGKDMVLLAVVPCGGAISITVEPVGFDASLYLVTDCSDIEGSCVAASDDGGIGQPESLTYGSVHERPYTIIIDARDAGSGGSFTSDYSFGIWDIPPGACCFPDGHCEFIHPDLCTQAGGEPHICLPCDPNPCSPTPVQGKSWGEIKRLYR